MSDTLEIQISENHTLRGIHKKPKKDAIINMKHKLILMLHDFPGDKSNHNDLYGDLESILNKKGFHTLRFDFTGCGESDGDQQNFDLTTARQDMEAVKIWASENGYRELSYISEGLGSTCALLNMEINVKCQVMMWPGLNPPALAKHLFNADTIEDEWKKIGYTLQDGERIGINFINALSHTNLSPYFRDIVMPVLILHGSADERFPIDDLNLIRNRASSKRIEITTFHDAGYGLPDAEHRESMFFHIGQFLEKFA